jgi:hypothetical protein
MKVPYAARFATMTFLVAALYTWMQMQPGLPGADAANLRQAWVLDHTAQWSLGWWLWLLAIFSWMVLLVVLAWTYLPAHRVAGMLQSGLLVIAAVLAISGVVVWMNVLPTVLAQPALADSLTPVIDALAVGLLGAGCFMGGGAMAWIAWDLTRQSVLARPWPWFAFLAGLCLLPVPFLSLHPYLLSASLLFWLIWCLWLATHRRLPSPFAEWPVPYDTSTSAPSGPS